METRKGNISDVESKETPQQPTQQEIRTAILCGFRRQLKPMEIFNECQTEFGECAPSLVTVSKWCKRYQAGHFSVEDEPREGRPKSSTDDTNVALVKARIEEDPSLTQNKIGAELGLNAMTVSRILHNLGYAKKSARWVREEQIS